MPHKEAWPEYINLLHRQHKGNSIAKRGAGKKEQRGEGAVLTVPAIINAQ